MEYPNPTWQEKENTAFLFTGFSKNYVEVKRHDLHYRKQSHKAYACYSGPQMRRKWKHQWLAVKYLGRGLLHPFCPDAQAETMHKAKTKEEQNTSILHLL